MFVMEVETNFMRYRVKLYPAGAAVFVLRKGPTGGRFEQALKSGSPTYWRVLCDLKRQSKRGSLAAKKLAANPDTAKLPHK